MYKLYRTILVLRLQEWVIKIMMNHLDAIAINICRMYIKRHNGKGTHSELQMLSRYMNPLSLRYLPAVYAGILLLALGFRVSCTFGLVQKIQRFKSLQLPTYSALQELILHKVIILFQSRIYWSRCPKRASWRISRCRAHISKGRHSLSLE
jgi:hypothetical protein